ncbi:hypothetical protein BDF14DRAFT_1857868 [Spinellus fusiger]|nr:hypothetical protein BDF14DRAFT_1857868 [Spinellus fusiger]
MSAPPMSHPHPPHFIPHHPNNSTVYSGLEHLQPLEEPVPFEDFQFSFGLDPDFAMPVPFDPLYLAPAPIPPAPHTLHKNKNSQDMLRSVAGPFIPLPLSLPTSTVLNEDDQKTFSQFLDTFFLDQEPPPVHDTQSLLYTSMGFEDPHPFHSNNTHRRPLFIESGEQPKRPHAYHASMDIPADPPTSKETSKDTFLSHHVYLQHSHAINNSNTNDATTALLTSSFSHSSLDDKKRKRKREKEQAAEESIVWQKKSQKLHKELLTEEEKRTNHIMSEQKRRSNIRTGFKELTDIVPTLKNVNHSKSTVLFKAVDYIRVLEKKNKLWRERLSGLEMRIKVNKGHRGGIHASHHLLASPPMADSPQLAAAAALVAHKKQQQQLMALQEQLHLHQKMLSCHHDGRGSHSKYTSSSSRTVSPYLQHYQTARPEELGAFKAVGCPEWWGPGDSFHTEVLLPIPQRTDKTREEGEEPLPTAVSA